MAKSYISEFQTKIPKAATKPPRGHIQWRPPQGETYKTNYDGAVFTETGEADFTPGLSGIAGSLEALAARRAVKFTVELGFTDSEFEGDSEIVCKALGSADCSHSSIGQIVKDIMSMISSLRTYTFSHVRQQGNGVAHALAKRAIVSFPVLVWMEHVPSDI
nr:uncharacterized protein LOC112039940 [Quercus suber]